MTMTAPAAPPGLPLGPLSVRMYRSGLLERLSRVHPAMPQVVYLPVIGVILWIAARRGGGGGPGVALFLTGLLAWTLVEYVLHRFVFHAGEAIEARTDEIVRRLPPGAPVMPALGWKEKAYFAMHGAHHLFPNDPRRIVVPPVTSLPLAALFGGAFRIALGVGAGPVCFAGFLTGYLLYDTTHYVVHHRRCRGRWSAVVKKWHMRHHFVDPDHGFGVSSPMWDYLLGTAPPRRASPSPGR